MEEELETMSEPRKEGYVGDWQCSFGASVAHSDGVTADAVSRREGTRGDRIGITRGQEHGGYSFPGLSRQMRDLLEPYRFSNSGGVVRNEQTSYRFSIMATDVRMRWASRERRAAKRHPGAEGETKAVGRHGHAEPGIPS